MPGALFEDEPPLPNASPTRCPERFRIVTRSMDEEGVSLVKMNLYSVRLDPVTNIGRAVPYLAQRERLPSTEMHILDSTVAL